MWYVSSFFFIKNTTNGLAGLTMYGALSKVEKLYEKGDWVVIMGAGGGLGHLYAFRADIADNS